MNVSRRLDRLRERLARAEAGARRANAVRFYDPAVGPPPRQPGDPAVMIYLPHRQPDPARATAGQPVAGKTSGGGP